jgi:hypothetical protein
VTSFDDPLSVKSSFLLFTPAAGKSPRDLCMNKEKPITINSGDMICDLLKEFLFVRREGSASKVAAAYREQALNFFNSEHI